MRAARERHPHPSPTDPDARKILHSAEGDLRAEQFLRDLNALFVEAIRDGGDPAFLQRVLDAGLRAVGGRRGFLALVHFETGELHVACTSGKGWTKRGRDMRLHLAQEGNRGITGHVALTKQPYMTGDVQHDPYYLNYFNDVKSEIAVPILAASGQTRGVINIDSPDPYAFTADDLAHLSALAQAAGAGLGVEGFRERESAMLEIGKTLTTTLDIDSLMNKVVDVTAHALRYEDCSVFLLDEQTNHLILKASRNALANRVGEAAYHVGEGVTGWIAAHGEPIRLEEPQSDPRWLARMNELPDNEIGAFLGVPIISRDKILGVLRVLRRKTHASWFSSHFTEVDERILMTIASQLGAAVENARSHQKLLRSERMAAWGELSARSAHMIGNRTFALKGDLNELNYLLETLPDSEQRRELFALAGSMERGVERLEELLREFRDFVVATQLTLAEADINGLLREVVQETFPKRSPVRLVQDLAEDLPLVLCDA
jgi:GAF domain-containing protein